MSTYATRKTTAVGRMMDTARKNARQDKIAQARACDAALARMIREHNTKETNR